jgi:2-polyprenyl-6-methoxyphenol hydroxylase-like FAD-dependent oxidoreductase
MTVAIIGGGIAGLALALNLHARKIPCTLYEAVPDVREIGVGITLLPHGMRELAALGLQDELQAAGLETTESAFFNRFGQKIYSEKRGRLGGNPYPEISIHRGRLHRILFDAARQRLGAGCIVTDRRCVGLDQDDRGVTIHFATADGGSPPPVEADIAIGCDGVNSMVRRKFYPTETMATSGINMWRGVTRRKPILDGRTYMRVGSINTGKMVIYPIVDDVDGAGNQQINWVAEMRASTDERNEWNKPGKLEDFFPVFKDWRFDWLDAAALITDAESILEYPMVDKDPVSRWTFGRITFAGDAAHPMYPRGSTGSAQALIDARVLADCLARQPDSPAALQAYEDLRRETTAKIVRANRSNPPDFINIRVEELTGDKPFERLEDYISQDELRALSDSYKSVAGYSLQDLRPL